MLPTILSILHTILTIYFFMMIAYILLSWVPEIRQSRFYYILHLIVNPYMRIFRGLIVIGNFDFTPIIGLLFYNFGLMAFGEFIASL